jgi:glycosyltransferase involved in cell wall biosynthesis
MRVCLFTDTIGDLNGVSRFIQDMAEQSLIHNLDLHIIASTAKYCPQAPNIHNFHPSLRFPMPFYTDMDIALPPKKSIKEKIKELKPEMIHISTPGAVGYLGLKIAKELKIPYTGTYHTDFPAYIKDNTQSDILKRVTDKTMAWFYKDFKLLFSRSKEYIDILNHDIHFDPQKVKIIKPGTNLKKFNPKYREAHFWQKYAIKEDATIVLYVGRITKEKNIPFLFDIWQEYITQNRSVDIYLVLVGEGSLKESAMELYDHNIRYLGPIIGEELSKVYSSSDFFIFPSLTDTLGQVVMESQASGLPVIVSNIGGPQSLVNQNRRSGFVIDANDKQEWVKAIKRLHSDKKLREEMGKNAVDGMTNFPIEDSFEGFWKYQKEIYERA